MKWVANGALAVALTLGSAAPALAQHQRSATGSHVSEAEAAVIRSKGADEENSLILMREFASCTYTLAPKKVARAVMLTPGEDGPELAKLASSQCLDGGQMRFSSELFRGALYGELFRRREAQRGGEWQLPVQSLPTAVPVTDLSSKARANLVMLDLADCVYHTAPAAMREVVLQRAGSADQRAAFQTIIPNLGPCVPAGLTMKLNRMALEHAFAEYLYRAPSAATAAGAS